MRKILLFGAGRSTPTLIKYILDNAKKENWFLTVADKNLKLIKKRIKNNKNAKGVILDINNKKKRQELIKQSDIVISMLPANLHLSVVKDCIHFGKDMLTASYLSNEIKSLNDRAIKSGIIIMNEMGLDPGIDHMSAMKEIDILKNKNAKISAFESFTGGLPAPGFDNNPWNYKFTWNPRNVILAGQGGVVKFIQEGKYKYIPYHKLFRRTEIIEIEGYGKFEGYANRDSLKYRDLYGLEDIPTFYRGTLRRPGFCRAWDVFVQLGATDDSYIIEDSENMTYREFINSFLAYNPKDSVELKLMQYLKIYQDEFDLFEKLKWLDIFKNIKIGLKNATPAMILQHILEKKWKLKQGEKDMIVMWHKINFELNNKKKSKELSLVVIGDGNEHTAMAKTVGLTVAIACKLILNKVIKSKGIHIPISEEIYIPVLRELEKYGIRFIEKEK